MIRLLADENIPRDAITALRHDGHDVAWINELAKSAGDPDIALRAQREQHLILTFDQEFAERILSQRVALPAGVILCRFSTDSPQMVADTLSIALQRPLPWAGHFAVLEPTDVRIIPLASP